MFQEGKTRTHVNLLHLRSQLGHILLDRRRGAQPLELLFNGFYTLEVVGHLRKERILAFQGHVYAERGEGVGEGRGRTLTVLSCKSSTLPCSRELASLYSCKR